MLNIWENIVANKKINEILKRKEERQIEFQNAVDVLVRLGALIPAESVTLYHGRASKPEEVDNWQVDVSYQNAGKQADHNNLNIVNGLSTSPSLEDASKYARGRARDLNQIAAENGGIEAQYVPEYYEIKPESSGLYIINNFDFKPSKLSAEELKEYYLAFNVFINYEPTELAPVKFEHRRTAGAVYQLLSERLTQKMNDYDAGVGAERLLSKIDIENAQSELFQMGFQIDLSTLATEIAGALNARELLAVNPGELVSRLAFRDNRAKDEIEEGSIRIKASDGKTYKVPVNSEYVSSWLTNNHIIGVSKDVFDTGINNCFMFDLEKINTKKALGDKLQSIIQEFGEFSKLTENAFEDENLTKFLESSSPEETMEVFRADPKFKMYFDFWSGVWERFSIGEHTETTMRVFEDSFARTTPKEIAPFVKMALACHDIGKGLINNSMMNARNKLEAIDEETTRVAGEFCDYFGMNENLKNMLIFAIVEGQKYTSQYYIHKRTDALEKLKKRCSEVLAENLKREPTEAEISAFVKICKIIQNCDSGAYTRYGITRDEKTGKYYRNGNDMFTKSFHTPTDIRKRAQHMIEPDEPQSR